jgi:hypothetical protein
LEVRNIRYAVSVILISEGERTPEAGGVELRGIEPLTS